MKAKKLKFLWKKKLISRELVGSQVDKKKKKYFEIYHEDDTCVCDRIIDLRFQRCKNRYNYLDTFADNTRTNCKKLVEGIYFPFIEHQFPLSTFL